MADSPDISASRAASYRPAALVSTAVFAALCGALVLYDPRYSQLAIYALYAIPAHLLKPLAHIIGAAALRKIPVGLRCFGQISDPALAILLRQQPFAERLARLRLWGGLIFLELVNRRR